MDLKGQDVWPGAACRHVVLNGLRLSQAAEVIGDRAIVGGSMGVYLGGEF